MGEISEFTRRFVWMCRQRPWRGMGGKSIRVTIIVIMNSIQEGSVWIKLFSHACTHTKANILTRALARTQTRENTQDKTKGCSVVITVPLTRSHDPWTKHSYITVYAILLLWQIPAACNPGSAKIPTFIIFWSVPFTFNSGFINLYLAARLQELTPNPTSTGLNGRRIEQSHLPIHPT